MSQPNHPGESTSFKAVVIGARGYVGGELLRLLSGHPACEEVVAVARSGAGDPIVDSFSHLQPLYGEQCFVDLATALGDAQEGERWAIFTAVPHGTSASLLSEALPELEQRGVAVKVVDLAADFRLASPEDYESTYRAPHGDPSLYPSFVCALPDLLAPTPDAHIAHPGCFTTAVSLAAAPLVAEGLSEGRIVASCITGSTGSGRAPGAGTHHPHRHANLVGYSPLVHRHRIEMEQLMGAVGEAPDIIFLPHSGPFSRGIHATLSTRLSREITADQLRDLYRDYYAHSSFVTIVNGTPNLKDVVGSNHCRLGVAAHGDEVVIYSVIDNLLKGAAGGAIQWMNRLFKLAPETGLEQCSSGWS